MTTSSKTHDKKSKKKKEKATIWEMLRLRRKKKRVKKSHKTKTKSNSSSSSSHRNSTFLDKIMPTKKSHYVPPSKESKPKTEMTKVEPTKAEPTKAEPTKVEPTKVAPPAESIIVAHTIQPIQHGHQTHPTTDPKLPNESQHVPVYPATDYKAPTKATNDVTIFERVADSHQPAKSRNSKTGKKKKLKHLSAHEASLFQGNHHKHKKNKKKKIANDEGNLSDSEITVMFPTKKHDKTTSSSITAVPIPPRDQSTTAIPITSRAHVATAHESPNKTVSTPPSTPNTNAQQNTLVQQSTQNTQNPSETSNRSANSQQAKGKDDQNPEGCIFTF